MKQAVLGILTLMAGVVAVVPTLQAAPPVAETVLVMTNAADRNEVIAFEQSQDGQFYETHRYDTGGRGSGGVTDPLGSQGSLTLSQDHSLLFAANAGSGTVSEFSVHHGHLELIDKVASGGSSPVAVAQWNNLVYVLNAGGAGSVVGFRLGDDGHLRQIKNSTTFLTSDLSGASSISIRPDGQFVVVTERKLNQIDTFQIQPDGTLGPIMKQVSTAPGVFSVTFDPNGDLLVSETGPAGAVNGSAISSYTVLSSGILSVVSQSLPTFGAANCWNVVTPNGKFVYTSNAGTATISGFSIGAGGVLSPIGATVVATNPAGSTNLDVAVSGDGKYLFSLNSGAGTVSVFAIGADGSLTSLGEIPGLPQSAGFNGIAAL